MQQSFNVANSQSKLNMEGRQSRREAGSPARDAVALIASMLSRCSLPHSDASATVGGTPGAEGSNRTSTCAWTRDMCDSQQWSCLPDDVSSPVLACQQNSWETGQPSHHTCQTAQTAPVLSCGWLTICCAPLRTPPYWCLPAYTQPGLTASGSYCQRLCHECRSGSAL